jgi:hypothetical protein
VEGTQLWKQMVLHMENIAHATADDLINKSSRKVKAAAQKAFAYCMKVGPEKVTFHHYCNYLSKTWDDGPYKCKVRGTYGVAK